MASENNENPDLVIVGAGLFARQMKTVGNMTRNALLSWQALLERAVRAIINGSTLTDRERMVLHRVNTRHAWWANDLSLPWVENGDGGLRPCTMRTRNMLLLPVPAYLLKLSRRIVTHAITRTPIPDLSHVRTLVLDAIIAKPERPHAHTDTRFGWWIRVATLTKGKPVLIPVDRNEYFEQQYAHAIKHGGGLCGVIQLTRHDNGTLSCALVLDRPDAPMRMDGKPLGIDYGMADALMADSDGNLMGHAMLATLKRYDLRLTQLGAWLQRRHIKPSTNHEYRRLQHRIRAYVANEIGRILNRDRRTPRTGAVQHEVHAGRHLRRLPVRIARHRAQRHTRHVPDRLLVLQRIHKVTQPARPRGGLRVQQVLHHPQHRIGRVIPGHACVIERMVDRRDQCARCLHIVAGQVCAVCCRIGVLGKEDCG